MSKLGKIKDFVQKTAQVISSVVEVELLIIDNELEVIASTGAASKEVGKIYSPGSLTNQVMNKGNYILVDEPRQNPVCKNCPKKQPNCLHTAVLVYPIEWQEERLGSICMAAVGEDQRQLLLSNEEHLVNFIDKIALLIATAVTSQEIQEENLLLANRFKAVINAVYEGILAVDDKGKIIHYNRSAGSMLNLHPSSRGKHINEIFPDLSLEELHPDFTILEKDLFTSVSQKKHHFMGKLSPIKANNRLGGFVISFRPIQEVHKIASQLNSSSFSYTFNSMIGEEENFTDLIVQMRKVAKTESTVLIRGESGTGKEIFARAIHGESNRRQESFIALNCAAIPESLLESELFGYEEGAFTGAKKGGKPGKFELASGGTIFLDEIGDMPLHLQVKLLRVLETKFIERVGSNQLIPVNVRIIAATHRNLEEMLQRKEFREDLYYRLNVIPAFLPPLRERKADINLFIEYFIAKYNRDLGKEIKGIDNEARRILINYPWPGNIRELENAIEYAVNMETEGLINPRSLPSRIVNTSGQSFAIKKKVPKLKELEENAIRQALLEFGSSAAGKEKAARHLGISLATLYRKLKDIKMPG